MKYLLDTHALLWWITDDENLSKKARQAISDPDNTIYISPASGHEIAIKSRIGKLNLLKDPFKLVLEHIEKNEFQELKISLLHTLNILKLPLIHRDPFDRLLVSQSAIENIPIISNDKAFRKYKVKIIW